MAIDVDPKYGGSGFTFFSSILAIEELAKVDPSVSVLCDVQNTLINEFFRSYSSQELQDKYFPRLTKDLVRTSPSHTHSQAYTYSVIHTCMHTRDTHAHMPTHAHTYRGTGTSPASLAAAGPIFTPSLRHDDITLAL